MKSFSLFFGCLAGLFSWQLQAAGFQEGRYIIYSKYSGLALDVTGGSHNNGTDIQQWGYSGGQWQQFDVQYEGDGFYSIRAAHSGKALDVRGKSLAHGAQIIQYDFLGGDNQLWKMHNRGNGYYVVTSKKSGKALDIWEWSPRSGGRLRQADLTDKANQWFRFVPADSPENQSAEDGPSGFAAQDGGTTGGAGGKTVTVQSCQELKSALGQQGALIIRIPDKTIDCRTKKRIQPVCQVQCSGMDKYTYRVPVGDQTCTELGASSNNTVKKYRNETRLFVASDKTVIGEGPHSTVRGGTFLIDGQSNLIFRNFTITDINPDLVEASGGFSVSHVKHLWIDHMAFNQISDGYADLKDVKQVTLSWNHFNGYNQASCDNHHSYVMYADDAEVTYHHNFFENGGGRNPKLNKQETRAHLYNNYWKDISYYATNVNHGAEALIEGNYYENVKRPHWNAGGEIDARLSTNIYQRKDASGVQVKLPPAEGADSGDQVFQDITLYPYQLDKTEDLPEMLKTKTGPR